ncbi:hypothetical protein COT42_05545 [Candidatus Saganbacteria bacterium CG08_land_8_20_14_0_20_45_16]|uniref:Flagellar biosynthetic protein FliR n=1 Tax=Candidatus Saganbacteria bacterium CG08_land_8_20_14_0_20_45_16 TaxID=2014293 RepID=A0A2H0XWV5_UNCSA|nr:MAG: hypothetical protein COT42_05545 [Candidatus Saganbacteria bacterium CG08_land_8_20_14_0_20_45_16]
MIISTQQFLVYLLIVGRIAGVFIQAPILNSRSFPIFAKTSLVIWLALVLWFVVPINKPLPVTLNTFWLALIFEVAIGFVLGFVANLIFLGVQAAGEIIDLQMGLSVASALDPVFGAVISVIGRLTFFFAMIVFLAVNGHHLVLSALHQSFTVIPVGKMANFSSPHLTMQVVNLCTVFWSTAIKLAGPAVLIIFLSDFTFGIVSRVAPQVNVFMLGFQVKPSLGLITILFSLPFLVKYIDHLIEFMTQQFILLLNNIK